MTNLKKGIDLLFSKKYLLYTNVGLGGTFLALGDTIEQYLNKNFFSKFAKKDDKEKLVDLKESSTQIDINRVSAMAKSGLIIGCAGHYWYKFLDFKFPGTLKSTIIKKLACEMAIGPPWIFLTFLIVGFFEKQDIKKTIKNFKEAFFYVLIADWFFYVPAQSLNFKFIPPRYRFAYVVSLTVIYDIFLAFILHK